MIVPVTTKINITLLNNFPFHAGSMVTYLTLQPIPFPKMIWFLQIHAMMAPNMYTPYMWMGLE